MSIVQWPHAVSTQRGKCVCLCNILIFPTWIRVSITLMLAQYVITEMLWRWNINIMDYEINKMSCLLLLLSLCIKVQNEKCIWKIFVKYTQIRQSNTNTNTNISSCGFSNTNTNTNTDICVFKYKYKYKYVFDPSPGPGNGLVSSVNKSLPEPILTQISFWHIALLCYFNYNICNHKLHQFNQLPQSYTSLH